MAGNCGGGVLYCEDFEGLAGALPTDANFVNPGDFHVVSSGALKGSASLELRKTSAFWGSWFDVEAAPALESAYIRFDFHSPQSHSGLNFFMVLENGDSNLNDKSIRLRIHDSGAIFWNPQDPGDTVAPDVYSGGAQLASTVNFPVGQTTCFEFFYDNTNDLIRLWMNDNEVPGLTIDNDPNTGFDQRLLGAYGGFVDFDIRKVRLGWGGSANATVLYDNIAVSQTRIGCN
jgi:hypothetical protein